MGGSSTTGGSSEDSSELTGGTGATAGGTRGTSTGGGYGVGGRSSAGGASSATGGVQSLGGATPVIGGSSSAGGNTGTTGGNAATGGASAIDPNVSAAINACMDKLPYGATALNADQRAPIIKAIINTCTEFAPPGPEWQTYCQMYLVAAINAESSYKVNAGTEGASGDPTVGLLQIRFSSTVRDFADYGPINAMKRIGCDFGKVTENDSYATKGAMMIDVNCNIALAAWYIFTFASGNGGPDVVWVYQYCDGEGVKGNLHIGMASFLMGADAAHSSLSGADFYYNEIKGWFDPCVTYSGTHPFELPIQPNMKKYCG